MGTVYIVITLLGLAALLGMYLLSLILRSKQVPKGATIIHGLMAGVALVLLIAYSVSRENSGPLPSIIVLILAAISGLILNYRDLTGRKVPKWLGLGHGLIAVAGFVILLLIVFCD